ncbi:MAG: gliding motility-associated C-terminal domain-containing protein [Prevotellaceae bacterium]|jgi:gliding motility-associated-like protein|nr:gliding motility-associated C-terminal domain-containing protein [Prevotellaceae bacterium]
MKNIGTIVFILLFFGSHNIINAQCDFELDIDPQNSTCLSTNGKVRITLSGDDIDTDVFISISKSGGNPYSSNENGHLFELLPTGTYSVTAEAKCKNSMNKGTKSGSFTIISEYSAINAAVNADRRRSSLNCFNTGEIAINVRGSVPPYTAKIVSYPEAYKGEKVFMLHAPGEILFKELAPGDYTFSVSDNCITRQFDETIDYLDDDFPPNPFEEYLHFQGCNSAYLEETSLIVTDNIYWNNMRNEYYEVAFAVGESEPEDWVQGFPNPQYINLPEPYSKMYEAGKTMKVFMRLIGSECIKMLGEIKFSKPDEVNVIPDYISSCSDYGLKFHLDKENIVCPPFKWEIIDEETGEFFDQADDIKPNLGEQTTSKKFSYDKHYTLKITDGNDVKIKEKDIFLPTQTSDITALPAIIDCDGYDLPFRLGNEEIMCAPFKWEIIDEETNTVFLDSGTDPDIEPFSTQTAGKLLYDKDYTIIVSDKNGKIAERTGIRKDALLVEIKLNDPQRSCDSYKVPFYLENEKYMCPPFKWEIIDETDGTVFSGDDNLTEFGTQTVENLSYDRDYTIKVTDGNGNFIEYSGLNYAIPKTEIVTSDISDNCKDYGVSLSLKEANLMCDPVRWEITDKESGTVVWNDVNNNVSGLLFDKDYEIKAVDAYGKEAIMPNNDYYRQNDTKEPKIESDDALRDLYDYKLPYTVSGVCLPYKLKIFDITDPDNPVFIKTINSTEYENVIEDLEYDITYRIVLNDNPKIFIEHFEPAPERTIQIIGGGGGEDGDEDDMLSCDSYSVVVIVNNMNPIYTWIVYNENGSKHSSGSSEDNNGIISGLKYSSKYTIEINDGTTIQTYEIGADEVKFPTPYFSNWGDYGYECKDYKFQFDVNDIYCYPYTWEVRNKEKGTVDPGATVNEDDPQHHYVTLHYDTEYEIIVTYSTPDDTKKISMPWSKATIKPDIIHNEDTDLQCEDYKFNFTLSNIYCPYKLEIIDKETGETIFESPEEDNPIPGDNTISGPDVRLLYDKEYEIIITESEKPGYTSVHKRPSVEPTFEKKIVKIDGRCDYEAQFKFLNNMYCDYRWEVVNSITGETIEGTQTLPLPIDPHSIPLQYDTLYTLTITYGKHGSIVRNIIEESKTPILSPIGYDDYKCDDYEFQFKVDDLQCYPYKWEIRDSNDEYITGEESENNTEPKVRLEYGMEYTVRISDGFGHIIPIPVTMDKKDAPAPDFDYSQTFDTQCDKYKQMINITHISCFPYKLMVKDSEGTIVPLVTEDSEGTVIYHEDEDEEYYTLPPYTAMLEYGKEYTITLTDADGKEKIEKQLKNQTYTHPGFDINPLPKSICLDQLSIGYIEIVKKLGEDMQPGTKIHFVDGPQIPVHTDVELNEIIPRFYPFSQNYKIMEDVEIKYGDYFFEITNTCGKTYPLNVKYERSVEADGLGYMLGETSCSGVSRISPTGNLTVDGKDIPKPWFVMREKPTGATGDIGKYITSDEDFELSETGIYVFEIAEKSGSCGVEEFVIDHVEKISDLDNYSSYICGTDEQEEGKPAIGNIRVQPKDGKEPYTYTLFEGDSVTRVAGIDKNNTGEFQYGSLGESYVVQVVDDCGTLFYVRVEISSLENMALINGIQNVCVGEEIVINSLMLGADSYEWTGPFEIPPDAKYKKDLIIPNATVSGEYTVKIKPSGCSAETTQSIEITVHDVPAPEASSVELCVDETGSYTLNVEPDDGCSLQWYNEDHEPLTKAPTISLSEVKDTVFYVTQTLNSLSCVSEEAEIEVRINPLAEKNAYATGWACEGGEPQITVTGVVDGYQYTVYDGDEAVYSFTGVTATDENGETMIETMTGVTVSDDKIFSLKTATATGCTLPESVTALPVEVSKLRILSPESPLVYVHGEPYSEQFESNAEEPEESIYTYEIIEDENHLVPEIITLESTGSIHGTVPRSKGYAELKFIVTVTDKKGCKASQPYTLQSCGPAPELTADPEVQYCLGASSHSLLDLLPEGLHLEWYDAEKKPLPTEPTPSTAEVGEQVFYVSRIDDALQCTSDTAEIKVKITPLPKPDFDAPDVNVCHGNSPLIHLSSLHSTYTYNIYADPEMTYLLESLTGETSVDASLSTVPEDTTAYYIRITDSLNCLSTEYKEVMANVIKLHILPDELPASNHDEPYSVQLESNAIQPEYTTEDELLPGITLSPDGLISGTVPKPLDEERLFTVKVSDENRCETSREYLLRVCGQAPETSPEVQFCAGAPSSPLQASSPEGLPLKWYDADMNELPEAPSPATDEVGEQVFYVSQINEALQCESDRAEIKVKITPLPKPDFDAPDVNVCHGNSPLIHLSNLHSTYTYNIYADPEMTYPLESLTGETSVDASLSTVPEDTTAYYIRITDSLNCVSTEYKEVMANVIKLHILPDELPAYNHDEPYSVQLESNAIQPEYTTEDELLTGITLSPAGLISGTVPKPVDEEKLFTVKVSDENRCEVSRKYLLRTCGPAPETPFAEVYNCIHSQTLTLQASSPGGLPLQWYDAEFNRLPEAPSPTTDEIGEQVFYVSQINEALQCESDKAKISVFTSPLPLIDFNASAPDVCFGSSPSILLDDIDNMSIYSVYPDRTFSNELNYLSGKNSGGIGLDDILETGRSYYILRTDSLGCVSTDWMEVAVDVIKLYIEPDKLPPYIKNTEYEQLLISNARSPVFSIADGHLPEGLILNAHGLIYGIVPGSYSDVSNIVTVEVQDVNGCRAEREYTFNGNIFVPKVFTPNGDGINDVFMRGHRLVIFDRLGIEIFQGNNGWDGTYKGKPVADDIYFYKLEYLDSGGAGKITSGYIGVHH